MMNKKTIFIAIGCMAGLILWQTVVNKLYPPIPKKFVQQPTDNSSEQIVSSPEQKSLPISVNGHVDATESLRSDEPRPQEEIISLSNDQVRIEFTSWGGGIRTVELLNHSVNGHGNVMLNGPQLLPALTVNGIPGAGAEGTYAVVRLDSSTVQMRTTTPFGTEVVKTYSLGENYLLDGQIQVSHADAEVKRSIGLIVGTTTPTEDSEKPDLMNVSWYVGEKYHTRALKHVAKGPINVEEEAKWVAIKNQFFAMILIPSTNGSLVHMERTELPPLPLLNPKKPIFGITASLEIPSTEITFDGAEIFKFSLYAGPKEYDRLVALRGGQEEVMEFGFFGAISVILLKSMNWCFGIIPNYGIAIILITIAIKVVFWPIQSKSMKAMKEMQKLQPLMQKLREKYKDDLQKQNQEVMKLYKEHKVNPFAGCLPMLVQIPVFFALFHMLRSAVELRGAEFLWIHDLSLPDTVFSFGGFPLNPLPVVMVAGMIYQQKITPTTADPQQAKLMMFMPVMMLVFFYNASSGLTLYWTVQQFLSIAQQWWSLRQPETHSVPNKSESSKSLLAGKMK